MLVRGSMVGLACFLLVGCGGEDGASAPSDPAPATQEDETPEATDPGVGEASPPPNTEDGSDPPTTPRAGLQILGADRSHLLFLDTGEDEWEVERVSAAPVVPLHAVTFLGCGTSAAARTTRAVGAWSRTGELLGRAPLPNLVRALGSRLTDEVARVDESYETGPDPAEVIGVGPLVRTEEGRLAMDPTFAMGPFHGEMEGCEGPVPDLRVPLEVPGVEAQPCESAAGELVSLTHATEEAPPTGFECLYAGSYAPSEPDPSWLGRPLTEIVALLPIDEGACTEEGEIPEDPWERLSQCTNASDTGGVTVCRYETDSRLFVALRPYEAMGCDAGPQLYMLAGDRIVARAGEGGELRVVGDVWIFGGRRAWFVGGPGRAPIRFGRVRPDVVREGADAAARTPPG